MADELLGVVAGELQPLPKSHVPAVKHLVEHQDSVLPVHLHVCDEVTEEAGPTTVETVPSSPVV